MDMFTDLDTVSPDGDDTLSIRCWKPGTKWSTHALSSLAITNLTRLRFELEGLGEANGPRR